MSTPCHPVRSPGRIFGLVGDPVAHSLSPAMHEAAFAAWGRNARYLAFRVSEPDFHAAVVGAAALGFGGLNVTVPHKVRAVEVAHRVAPEARQAGVANTLVFEDGEVVAHNTDGGGFLDALGEAGVEPCRRPVVLGGGGAGRAVVWALRGWHRGGEVVWVSRTPAALPPWPGVRRADYDRLATLVRGADLLVNATTVGLAGGPAKFPVALPLEDLAPGAAVVDLTYPARPGGLVDRARALGLRALDGRPMLLHQGVRAQRLWWGEVPPARVIAAMARVLDRCNTEVDPAGT